LETVKSKGLAHSSYYLSDHGEAVIIDPRRDCEIYVELAKNDCSEIRYIFETHRNEDYVIGSMELQDKTGAEICHSKETPFTYGEHNLSDEDSFKIGRLKIESIYTPGHTIDSMCFSVYDTWSNGEPILVFTGDTLFIGDVGRTDLLGLDIWKEMSEMLYYSLHEKLLTLGDGVLLYPSHTAGSICGSLISDREMSSIGYEVKTNPQLKLNREEFVKDRLENKMLRPPYFRLMEDWNLYGPPLLDDLSRLKAFSIEEFAQEWTKEGSIILDSREPEAFSGSHIPNSINIWLDGVSFFPGWIIGYDQNILLITERREDVETVVNYLHRIGYDNIEGYLCTRIREWRNRAKPFNKIGTLSAADAKIMVESEEAFMLDVREDHEWEDGHVKEARRIYVGFLESEAKKLPTDKPIIVTCASGVRSSIATSILKRKGFENVYNLLGGMKSWKRSGYPLVQGDDP
jgi:hydroxyacylglutathione hydrolase